jgi:hypothetical protein
VILSLDVESPVVSMSNARTPLEESRLKSIVLLFRLKGTEEKEVKCSEFPVSEHMPSGTPLSPMPSSWQCSVVEFILLKISYIQNNIPRNIIL